MSDFEIVKKFVRSELDFDKSGHGYNHAFRVYANAQNILKHEKGNKKIVLTAALIHDCIDQKLFNDVEKQISKVKELLSSLKYTASEIDEIMYIITHISWSHGKDVKLDNINAIIVRDSDRLDGIGAIGIIRAIEYGGSVGRKFYDLENIGRDGKFNKITNSTLSLFYERLLLVKEKVDTKTAKKIANDRHKFMKRFLNQFYKELPEERN